MEMEGLAVQLTIEASEELMHGLEAMAASEGKSVEQIAQERLTSLVSADQPHPVGSPGALLAAMRQPPFPSKEDVNELIAAIKAGRRSAQDPHLSAE